MDLPSRGAIIFLAGSACRRSTRRGPRPHSRSGIRTIPLGRGRSSPPVVAVIVLPRRRSRVTTRGITRRRSFAFRIVATRVKTSRRRRWGRRTPHPEIIVVPRANGGRGRIIAEVPRGRGRSSVKPLAPGRRRVIIETRISRRRVTRVFTAVCILPRGRRIVPGGRNTINERMFISRMARTTSERSSKCLSDIIRLPFCGRIEYIPAREVVGALPNGE